jgi:molecular chaperone DnaK (HSP70)
MLHSSRTARLHAYNGCKTAIAPPPVACKSNRVIRRNTLRCAAAAAAAAAVGIDLGTTNSAVAILRKGEKHPTILRDSTGSFTIPSVVAYSSDGSSTVGHLAKQQAASNPLNTFYSVKRLIGRRVEDVQDLELVYNIAADAQDGVQLKCPARGASVNPQEVGAAAAGS